MLMIYEVFIFSKSGREDDDLTTLSGLIKHCKMHRRPPPNRKYHRTLKGEKETSYAHYTFKFHTSTGAQAHST